LVELNREKLLGEVAAGFRERQIAEDPLSEGGAKVEDLMQLQSRIHDLEKAGIEKDHGMKNDLSDLRRTIQTLGADMAGKANGEGVKVLQSEVKTLRSEVPTEARIKELTSECLSDSDGAACQVIRDMVREKEEDNMKGKMLVDHENWDGVFLCKDGCADAACKTLCKPEHTEVLSKTLALVAEDDQGRLAEILASLGFEPSKEKEDEEFHFL